MSITGKQWLQIIQGCTNGFITGAALFTTLFGQEETLKIIASLGLANIVLTSIAATLLTQTSQVKDVLAMPGVQHIDINADANQALASLAIDPNVNKIAPVPNAVVKVTQTAQGIPTS